jgi:hypothetical protein
MTQISIIYVIKFISPFRAGVKNEIGLCKYLIGSI